MKRQYSCVCAQHRVKAMESDGKARDATPAPLESTSSSSRRRSSINSWSYSQSRAHSRLVLHHYSTTLCLQTPLHCGTLFIIIPSAIKVLQATSSNHPLVNGSLSTLSRNSCKIIADYKIIN